MFRVLSCVALALTLFSCVAVSSAASPRVPSVVDEFEGHGTTDTILGKFKMTEYYDYYGQRDRVDSEVLGFTQINLKLYNEGVEYVIYDGDCKKQKLDAETLYSYTPPPFATFVRNDTVAGHPVEIWSADFVAKTESSIDVTNPKVPVLVQFKLTLPFVGTTTITYSKITPGRQPDSLFDWAQWGCEPPVPPPTFSVSGYVRDATNLASLAGATVVVVETGDTATTTNSGYSFPSLPAGTYHINATLAGFDSAGVVVHIVNSSIPVGTTGDIILSPKLPSDHYRVVLTWGPYPRDLDSHLYLQGCEVYFGHRKCGSSATASLDVDVTSGYGPETISIADASAATKSLRHFVYIYTTGGSFKDSRSEVKLYGPSGLVDTMHVPNPTSGEVSDRYWSTWDIHPDGTFSRVNKITSAKPAKP
jgi:hypothetical protein